MAKSIINTEENSDQKRNKPFVIGIAGACGSGKTWFANKLQSELSTPSCIFQLDGYSKSQEFVNRLEYHYDNPLSIDYDKAFVDLQKLLQGVPVTLPIYDYISHSVISEKDYNSLSVIIIEGLYAFYDHRFIDVMDIKIWIEADENVCKERRIRRDIEERGDSQEESIRRHVCDSVPAFRLFYADKRFLADCIYINQEEDNNPLLIKMIEKYI